MLEAAAWGLLGASSLLAGALIGTRRRAIPTRALGLILGFGAGTLFSAVAFELTEDAYSLRRRRRRARSRLRRPGLFRR
jgi:ZIP family zinc transporter